jgi:hypothetical protein
LPEALRVRDADLKLAIVRPGALERLDAAKQRSDVADEQAACIALVPEISVDLDTGLERLDAKILRVCPDVCQAPEPVLGSAVGDLDHAGV